MNIILVIIYDIIITLILSAQVIHLVRTIKDAKEETVIEMGVSNMWLYIFDVFDKKVIDDVTVEYVYKGVYNCVTESMSKAEVFAREDLKGDYVLVLRSTMMM